ncbi:MAG: zinc ABC transporter substrate-binding protein [Rhodospirillales bacterium]|nr:MAG: zinc ABC transporter substrate-binding protein [Rhodospirillales bacterium]
MDSLLTRALFLLLLVAAALPARAEDRLDLVASFPVVADIARQVGGDQVTVTSLVPPETDPHAWQPRPHDMRQLAGADLVVVNGLGLEGWLDRAVAASGYRGAVVIASRDVTPIVDAGGMPDPHAWHSLENAGLYARVIAEALAASLPRHAGAFQENLAAFEAKLSVLQEMMDTVLPLIRPEDRVVVATHDAFAYLARDYGIRILSPQGSDSAAQASARRIAGLVGEIHAAAVKAVFVENGTDQRLARMIAQEAGVGIGGELYPGSLSRPGGPADDYLAMWEHNVLLMLHAMNW